MCCTHWENIVAQFSRPFDACDVDAAVTVPLIRLDRHPFASPVGVGEKIGLPPPTVAPAIVNLVQQSVRASDPKEDVAMSIALIDFCIADYLSLIDGLEPENHSLSVCLQCSNRGSEK